MLLVLDTSSAGVTVAVAEGTPGAGGRVLAAASQVDGLRHAEVLAPLLARVCARAGVRAADARDIAVGVGPGPFTGLRVGLVTARTLAFATGARLVGACSLDVLAAGVAEPPTEFLAAADARRREVYWARYARRDGTLRRVAGPAVDHPGAVPGAAELPVVGQGAVLHAEAMPNRLDAPVFPDAGVLARLVLAGAVELLPADPLYLRRPDARPAAQLR